MRAGDKIRGLGGGALVVLLAGAWLAVRFVREPQNEHASRTEEVAPGATGGSAGGIVSLATNAAPRAMETPVGVATEVAQGAVLSTAAGGDSSEDRSAVASGQRLREGPVFLAAGEMLSPEEFDALASRLIENARGPEVRDGSREAGMPPATPVFRLGVGGEAGRTPTGEFAAPEFVRTEESAGRVAPVFTPVGEK